LIDADLRSGRQAGNDLVAVAKSSQHSNHLGVSESKDGKGILAHPIRLKEKLWGVVVGRNFHPSQALTPSSLQVRWREFMEDQKSSRKSGRLGRRIRMPFLLIGCCHR
jgi:hypothetical protein